MIVNASNASHQNSATLRHPPQLQIASSYKFAFASYLIYQAHILSFIISSVNIAMDFPIVFATQDNTLWLLPSMSSSELHQITPSAYITDLTTYNNDKSWHAFTIRNVLQILAFLMTKQQGVERRESNLYRLLFRHVSFSYLIDVPILIREVQGKADDKGDVQHSDRERHQNAEQSSFPRHHG